jgi:hypothetical protein
MTWAGSAQRYSPRPIRFRIVAKLVGRGRDSAPVRGVPYKPAALYGVYRAKFELVEVLWRVVATMEEL